MDTDTFMTDAGSTAEPDYMEGVQPTHLPVYYTSRFTSRLRRIAPTVTDYELATYIASQNKFHPFHCARKDPLPYQIKPAPAPPDGWYPLPRGNRHFGRMTLWLKRPFEDEAEERERKRRRTSDVAAQGDAQPEVAPEVVPGASTGVVAERAQEARPEILPEVAGGVVPEAVPEVREVPEFQANVDAEDHPPAIPQVEGEHGVVVDNAPLAGHTDADVQPAPGLFRAAHLAIQQCVRSGVQIAATLRRHFARSEETRRTTHTEDDQDDDDLAVSAQLQAEMAEHMTHLSSLAAIPSVDDPAAAQLQAELTGYASIFPPPVIFAPPTVSMNAANLVPQDQHMINSDAMASADALHPADDPAQEAPIVAIQEPHASAGSNEEPGAAAMSNASGQPSISAAFETPWARHRRTFPLLSRPTNPALLPDSYRTRVVRGHTRSYYIAPDADVDEAELARQLEAEERGEPYPPEEPEAATTDGIANVENIPPQQEGIDQQPVAEVVAPQLPTDGAPEAEPQLAAEQQDAENVEEDDDEEVEDEEDDGDEWRYRAGVPPLMPWLRRRRIRRVAPVAPAAPAPEALVAPAVPRVPVFPAPVVLAPTLPRPRIAPATPARPQAELETEIEETANQLAATTVAAEEDVSPAVPRDSDPTGRSVSWWVGDTPLGRPVSAVRLFHVDSPPIQPNRAPPLHLAEWQAIEEQNRRREEREREQQRQQLVEEKRETLGRVRIARGEAAVTPLPDSWEEHLARVMSGPAHRTLVSTLEGAELTKQKLETCFTPMAWLNDEVVNGHLALIVDYLRRAADNLGRTAQPKYYAFNSFFYKKLREGSYESVKRWTRRAKIHGKALLDVETLFIPVHEHAHWTLLVLRPKTRTIEYFDSLYSDPQPFIDNAKEWLKGELGELYDEEEWFVLNSPSPRQDNGSDCGVFLLTTAKAIAFGLEPTVYGPSDISLIRRKIVAELLNGGLKGDFEPAVDAGERRL